MGIGAKAALEKAGNIGLDSFGGEMGYIDDVIHHALALDQLADPYELSGVFAYEVAEEFGERWGWILLSHIKKQTPI